MKDLIRMMILDIIIWKVEYCLQLVVMMNIEPVIQKRFIREYPADSNWGEYRPRIFLSKRRIAISPNRTISSNDEYRTGDALMARLFYSYDNRYMITGTVRRP